MAVEIVPLTHDLAREVVSQARQADVDEFRFASEETMLATVLGMMRASHRASCGLIDGKAVCIFGVIPATILSVEAFPWAVATADVEDPRYRRAFLRGSKENFNSLIKGYSHLWGVVHERNQLARRWLKWLGFKILPDRFEINGGGFHRFEMRL